MRVLWVLVALTGCPFVGEAVYFEEVQDADGDGEAAVRFGGDDCVDDDPTIVRCDADADGFRSVLAGGDDCNDDPDDPLAPFVFPGASELCNGVDDDCNQLIDDEATDRVPVYLDNDLDGRGSEPAGLACPGSVVQGLSLSSDDCDDNADFIFPGAVEFCDGIDRDCDGDGYDTNATDAFALHADNDLDGFAAGPPVGAGCRSPGLAPLLNPDDEDCDDADPHVFPGAPEIAYDGVDQACDGADNEWDIDGDGFEERAPDNDCDDRNPNIFPGAVEVCDGVDTDCDGLSDSDDPDVPLTDKVAVYLDQDLDDFGSTAGVVSFCPNEVPPQAVLIGGDCDDHDPLINPDATEIPHETPAIDQDCDGGANEWDFDGDGYESRGQDADCDDHDPNIHPGAAEACDGIDSDCDGLDDNLDPDIDPALRQIWYPDNDLDGYGDSQSGAPFCPSTQPAGWLQNHADCDDSLASVNPGAGELCGDGVDNDCDGTVDLNPVDGITLYRDSDGDGRGSPGFPINACPGAPGASPFPDDCDDGDPSVFPGAVEICNDGIAQDCDRPQNATDCDADGFDDASLGGTDCDDDDATVRPNAPEICDGIDNDCNGLSDSDDPGVDNSTLVDFYDDLDGDGYGSTLNTTASCSAPPNTVANGDDCDDADATIHPGAVEICNGIDENCNLATDEDPVLAPVVWYRDFDQDGAGDAATVWAQGCNPPDADWSLNADDCNDFDPNVQFNLWYLDQDGDTFGQAGAVLSQCGQPLGYVSVSGDCDDNNIQRNPGEAELCDGIDNDCDGVVDGGAADEQTWYLDGDGDGFGDPVASVEACDAPAGYVFTPGDCNDNNAGIRPGAIEICDFVDNDCDLAIDDNDPGLTNAPVWYPDIDGDGFGDTNNATPACLQPGGYVGNAGDCDDAEATINPFGTEVCGGADEDCDGLIDDADPDTTASSQWFTDADNDGYGDPTTGVPGCVQPPGTVADNQDCLDSNGIVNPQGMEICNGIDDDCNGATDDGVSGGSTFYADTDGDGFGDSTNTVQACFAPSGFVANSFDCDDTDAAISPFADEICDTDDMGDPVDNDCDGLTNEMDNDLVGGTTYYRDVDTDTFGDPANTVVACAMAPVGFVSDSTDCDDQEIQVYPGATEVCNLRDDDCNSLVDDNASNATSFFRDMDGDGFGSMVSLPPSCSQPPNASTNNMDCDDNNAQNNPSTVVEHCDNVDNDCDGFVDDLDTDSPLIGANNYWADDDDDGFYAEIGEFCADPPGHPRLRMDPLGMEDCVDNDANIFPGQLEICDGSDQNCSGIPDDFPVDPNHFNTNTYYRDDDNDGFGNPMAPLVFACAQPVLTSTNINDCDDFNPAVNPMGDDATCDGVDQNCSGDEEDATNKDPVYQDFDGDGYGSTTVVGSACAFLNPGETFDNTDCDDFDFDAHPGAVWYTTDNDGDSFVGPNNPIVQCNRPSPPAAPFIDDCDDNDLLSHPGAAHIGSSMPFTTIAEGQAACGPMLNELFLETGNYVVAFDVTDSLFVQGMDPMNPPTLQQQPATPVFNLFNPAGMLEVRDVTINLDAAMVDGHAIFGSTNNVYLDNVWIVGTNTLSQNATSGAAIDVNVNTFSWVGGGVEKMDNLAVRVDQAQVATFDQLRFSDNKRNTAIAADLRVTADTVNIYDTVFEDNRGTGTRSVTLVSNNVSISGVRIRRAGRLALSRFNAPPIVTLEDLRIEDAPGNCLVLFDDPNVTITDSVFGKCNGAGIAGMSSTAQVYVNHSVFHGSNTPFNFALDNLQNSILMDNAMSCGVTALSGDTNASTDCDFDGWPNVSSPYVTVSLSFESYSATAFASSVNIVPAEMEGNLRGQGNDGYDIGISGGGFAFPSGYDYTDSDGDGMGDGWETYWFGDANTADPNKDPDADGATNAQEWSVSSQTCPLLP